MATTAEPTRREFLVGAVGLGAMLSRPLRASTQEALPIVGFGSSQAVLESPSEGTEPIADVIRTLVRYGGRVVDTSPRTEAIDRDFGRVLQDPELEDRLFLATKINTRGEQSGIDQMRHS